MVNRNRRAGADQRKKPSLVQRVFQRVNAYFSERTQFTQPAISHPVLPVGQQSGNFICCANI